MESDIQKIKKQGLISIWSYSQNKKNYPGWNISYDSLGFIFLKNLLSLMINSEWSSHKTFEVNMPTKNVLMAVNNMNGNASWMSPRDLTLQYRASESDSKEWKISLNSKSLTITMGREKQIELMQQIIKTRNGSQDIAISDCYSENILYFWAFI